MSWRAREERSSRWSSRERERERERERRSPVWEARVERERERRHERERRDRSRERRDRDRDRDRDRRRSPAAPPPRPPRDDDVPAPPSPPTISRRSSRDRSTSSERDARPDDAQAAVHASPGDWFCKCGSYNFKRRQICYRRNCQGKRSEGVVYGGDGDKSALESNAGITKRLLFRRLDALTTEEKILEEIKERCSKSVLDSIAGITIGREALTGASKCLAYINFNSIADSTAAHSELMSLDPALAIDGREVLVSFYNEPQKAVKPAAQAPADYSAYYAQMAGFGAAPLSEADRVNAAAAVAQCAISAAAARGLQWAPAAAPVAPAAPAAPARPAPTGDAATRYAPPDVRTFLYDETSGYYYDPSTGLYYDGATQYFYNGQLGRYMYWDAASSTYVAATHAHQNTEQPKLPSPPEHTADNTMPKEPEEKKKKEKEDKVKVAKKIAKDMERWARTLNQKKEHARSHAVAEQAPEGGGGGGGGRGAADIGYSVLGAAPAPAPHPPPPRAPAPAPAPAPREPSPPPAAEEFLTKSLAEPPEDPDEGIIDWSKLTCLLCKRRFPTAEVLTKHKTLSELHKQNLCEHRRRVGGGGALPPGTNGYRDRAAERRMKFGEEEPATPRRRYSPPPPPVPQSAPPPNVVDTIGGKMLQKMGWSMGRGLGKSEQGRVAPVEAAGGAAGAGLGAGGARRGIYTPTPGETYRDTVKKLMIARYKEVVGQEDTK